MNYLKIFWKIVYNFLRSEYPRFSENLTQKLDKFTIFPQILLKTFLIVNFSSFPKNSLIISNNVSLKIRRISSTFSFFLA